MSAIIRRKVSLFVPKMVCISYRWILYRSVFACWVVHVGRLTSCNRLYLLSSNTLFALESRVSLAVHSCWRIASLLDDKGAIFTLKYNKGLCWCHYSNSICKLDIPFYVMARSRWGLDVTHSPPTRLHQKTFFALDMPHPPITQSPPGKRHVPMDLLTIDSIPCLLPILCRTL